MISILTNILHLDAVTDIFLFSKSGSLLYSMPAEDAVADNKKKEIWKELFKLLHNPQSTRFVFEQGSCYIFQTAAGFVVIVGSVHLDISSVESRCFAFDEKSVDSAERKAFFMQVLLEVDDYIKLSVIDELAVMADKDVGLGLAELLNRYDEFHHEVKDELLLSICRLLGDCSALETMKPLTTFIEAYTSSTDEINKEVEQEARVSLQQLEFVKQLDQEERPHRHEEISDAQVSASASAQKLGLQKKEENLAEDQNGQKSSVTRPNSKNISQKTNVEKNIKELLAKGEKQQAVAIIMKYIEAAARQKMFDKAEKLRDTLIKIDSMMLTEIIRAAEIIEEYKEASIDPEVLKTWDSLFEMLSAEEFTALYHAMTSQHYSNGEIIVQQGALLPQLLFINSGQVQLYTHANGREVPLKTIGQGEVIGAGTFFEASVWTISVRSLGADIFILSRKRMEALADKHASLESRLIDFSARFVSPNVLFRKTKRSRRRYDRKSLAGRAAATLLNKEGKETEVSFKGDLFDISRGGLSFCVRVSRKKNANLLFGSRIRVGIPVGRASTKKQQFYTGKVVAVRAHHVIGNEYSLHIQFDRQLSHQEIQQVLGQN